MVGAVCKSTIEQYLATAEQKYDQVVIDRCTEMKNLYHKKLVGKTEAEEFYNKCTNTAGASVDKKKEEQMKNYTNMCVDNLQNSEDESGLSFTEKVKKFFSDGNFMAIFDGEVGVDVNETLSDLKDEYKIEDTKEERLRLYDSGIRSVGPVGINSVALVCVIGGMLAGVVGLVAVVRRSSQQPLVEGTLIDSEESDSANA